MDIERLQQQIFFLIKVDYLKKIYRRTTLVDNSRCETVAEHSWHFALIALILCEYTNKKINLFKVIKNGIDS